MLTEKKIIGKLDQIERRYTELRFEKIADVPELEGVARGHEDDVQRIIKHRHQDNLTNSPPSPPNTAPAPGRSLRRQPAVPQASDGRRAGRP